MFLSLKRRRLLSRLAVRNVTEPPAPTKARRGLKSVKHNLRLQMPCKRTLIFCAAAQFGSFG